MGHYRGHLRWNQGVYQLDCPLGMCKLYFILLFFFFKKSRSLLGSARRQAPFIYVYKTSNVSNDFPRTLITTRCFQ